MLQAGNSFPAGPRWQRCASAAKKGRASPAAGWRKAKRPAGRSAARISAAAGRARPRPCCGRRREPSQVKNWCRAPNGQTQPQKKRPKTKVSSSGIRASRKAAKKRRRQEVDPEKKRVDIEERNRCAGRCSNAAPPLRSSRKKNSQVKSSWLTMRSRCRRLLVFRSTVGSDGQVLQRDPGDIDLAHFPGVSRLQGSPLPGHRGRKGRRRRRRHA